MQEVVLFSQPTSREQLKQIASEQFGNLVKAVVDVEKKVMAVGGELHSDEEAFLLLGGSAQQDLWGINLYPEHTGNSFIEFDSMINIRPSQNNRSRGVEDEAVRNKIIEVVSSLIV